MTYSLTERKRIRKSFAKRATVQAVPFLIATQLESYTAFLQAHVAPESRRNEGLQAAFTSIFPITSHSGNARLEFVSFQLGEPPFDVKECQQRGLTYASPLRAKVRLVILDKEAPKPTTKEVKEQEVYMGEIPLMTTTGSFIINGTERVIVSQLHRSPGVFFEHDRGKTHSSGKLLFSARVIPYRGSWLDFEFDPKDIVYFRVDRRRKMPVTILLKALGFTPEMILKEFFDFDGFHIEKDHVLFEVVPERLRGEVARFDINDKSGKTLVAKDKRITVKHIRDMESAGIKKIVAPDDFIIGRALAHNVVNSDTGEILASANDEVTETLLAKLRESKVGKIQTLFTNDLDEGAYVSQTLRTDETIDVNAARVAIYRMMRPGEPPTEDAVEALFNGLFFSEERYDLSAVGRMKFNRRVSVPCETAWQLRLKSIALSKEAEEEVRAYFKHAPELSLGKVAIEGVTSEDAAQHVVDKMFQDLKSKGVDRQKLETKLEPRYTLSPRDIVEVIRILVELRNGRGDIDDIDHLGNRRVRSVGELAENQFRAGLVRVERAVKERLSQAESDNLMPHDLINAKPISAAIKEFFGSSQLSQFMDQTNPLSEITHKRRVSALGPGGLTRERAGFEVRDVHPTHYGRVCPIETPEGPNIGLINSLALYARTNKYGFLETPYRKVSHSKVTNDIVYLSAIEEGNHVIAQANAAIDKSGKLIDALVSCRNKNEFMLSTPDRIEYMDVAPSQIVSVAASLIPFLEHDDANRALMGSNMQRQAVPCLRPEKPLVGTGVERTAAIDSGTCVVALRGGLVDYVDSNRVVVRVNDDETVPGDVGRGHLQAHQVHAFQPEHQHQPAPDREAGRAPRQGRRGGRRRLHRPGRTGAGPEHAGRVHALERLQLRGLDPHLRARGIRRPVHLDPHRGTDGRGARHQARARGNHARHLQPVGGAAVAPGRVGHRVHRRGSRGGRRAGGQGDPEGRDPAHARGEAPARDLRREGLRREGHVAARALRHLRLRHRRAGVHARRHRARQAQPADHRGRAAPLQDRPRRPDAHRRVGHLRAPRAPADGQDRQRGAEEARQGHQDRQELPRDDRALRLVRHPAGQRGGAAQLEGLKESLAQKRREFDAMFEAKRKKLTQGDELPPGVLKMVKVYVAVKRRLQPGDKMAGRHGNKGVISKIVPVEDMPHMADGTTLDIVLNPLGVPSRMNVGQILETHLGWAAKGLGLKLGEMIKAQAKIADVRKNIDRIYNASGKDEDLSKLTDEEVMQLAFNLKDGVPFATPVFDGASEAEINAMLELAGLPVSGQVTLHDGRTGEAFDRPVTVGYMHVLKLHHLVDDKMHARSTGPYSLVTQQPLGGKAQFGGQRFGEMEVWALEAYGAAYTLQEMLTVKSDDITGRTKVYENIVKGDHKIDAGMPESFNVLVKEIRSLGIDIDLEKY